MVATSPAIRSLRSLAARSVRACILRHVTRVEWHHISSRALGPSRVALRDVERLQRRWHRIDDKVNFTEAPLRPLAVNVLGQERGVRYPVRVQ